MAQTWVPGVSVSQVGRCYDVNANLIFKWRRDPRYRPAGDGEGAPSFLPVEVAPEPSSPPSPPPAASDGRIEIALADGSRRTAMRRAGGGLAPDRALNIEQHVGPRHRLHTQRRDRRRALGVAAMSARS